MSLNEKFIYMNEKEEQIEFSALSPFFLTKISGVAGINNIITSSNSATDGSIYISSRFSERNIVIQGKLKRENRDINRAKLIKVLNPKLKGKLIYSNTDTNVIKYIDCRIEKSPDPVKDFISTFQISFICNDPYWKDMANTKFNIARWVGDFRFPHFIIPGGITMGHRQPSLIVNAINNGDIKTGMIIEFIAHGTLKNPSLFNVNTRESIKINKSMDPGEVITIDTNFGRKKIESSLNGVKTNILNYLDLAGGGSTFLQLDTGDNLLRYDADENLSNLEVNIYFNPGYLGV